MGEKLHKVEILQMGPYPAWDEKQLNSLFSVHRYFEIEDKRDFLEKRCAHVRGIATRGELVTDRKLMEALPSLEIIAVFGVGYDGVDVAAAADLGIRVTNTPDVLSADVADLGVAMMLALSRGILGGHEWVRSGDWKKKGPYPLRSTLTGKAAGVLGLGRIGTVLANRLEALDMRILYSARSPKAVSSHWEFVGDVVELGCRSGRAVRRGSGIPRKQAHREPRGDFLARTRRHADQCQQSLKR